MSKDEKVGIAVGLEALQERFGLMRRMEDRHGNLTNRIEDKDIWHLLDALRYIVGWLSAAGNELQEVVYNRVTIA